jgi:aminoglycoside phosphotransferase (APT) family kinase protein
MDRTTFIREHHARFGMDHARIVASIEQATGLEVGTVERIVRGDEYEVHRAHLVDGSVVYLRVAWPGEPFAKVRNEVAAMTLAREAGVPVPDVLDVGSIESEDGQRAMMVLRASAGRQLSSVLPDLGDDDRARVMRQIGRTLRDLHSIAMPGVGLPDTDGGWHSPAAGRRRYVANVLADSRHLSTAGFSQDEIEQIGMIVQETIVPLEDPPVLCHGDLSLEHIFIGPDLGVTGLIDWGLWRAGSEASELAGLGSIHPSRDLEEIAAGHGFPIEGETRSQLAWHTVTQAIGQIRWLVVSNQLEELDRPRTRLRRAVRNVS